LKSRLGKWKEPKSRVTKGYLVRYMKLVSSASTGATLD
jgi:dihydroxy-acid dehydratase